MVDFNQHVDSSSSIPSEKFLTMMESYGFHQYVTGPTHDKGHMLDLVFARPDDGLISFASVTSRISDHHTVECRLTICPPLCPTKRVLYRLLKSIDCDAVEEDILALPLLTNPETSLDGLVALYNDGLTLLLDKHAPVKMKSIVLRPSAPWINEEIQLRKAKRIWRMNKLTVSFEIYKDHAHRYSVLLKRVKSVHMQSEVAECGTNQRALYGLVNRLMGKSDVSSLPPHSYEQVLADNFGEFFSSKVSKIRAAIDAAAKRSEVEMNNVVPHQFLSSHGENAVLCVFVPVSDEMVKNFIMASPTKSCRLDPVPTFLLKKVLCPLVPTITKIVNLSLSTGTFPLGIKHAMVTTLDASDLGNYRPVSNLSFLSKLIERIVAAELMDHLAAFDVLPTPHPRQSAY
ncbi:uncharacterized protein LOC124323850 [Daphnia pulicaria]|uniref:uncharacterized protein LOC124323850 n=1 Tax=Daphnia pulicaria TaxID=35523 RepID=UPI001EEB0002|nr:uncharacterized protein LOC124323850 [Daphnia pulicaria]